MASTSNEKYQDYPLVVRTEGIIANEIMQTVMALGLPLKLDELTEGLGNCFPIAIIQQLRRPEIYTQLEVSKKSLTRNPRGPKALRHLVRTFITKSEHPNVARFQTQYDEFEGMIRGESWGEYWTRLSKDKVWVDYWFVQATAWYFQLDLWIVDCKSRDDKPFIQVSGNLDNAEESCNGPIITLGTKSSCHYQSLLPTEILHIEFTKTVNPDIMSIPSAKIININPLDIVNEDKIEVSQIQSKKDLNVIPSISHSNKAEQITAEYSKP